MIDIDHFKSVNDTYGHHVGDEVLRSVSKVIREMHKDNGLVCRYGGEEFCVVLPGADLQRSVETAEATRLAVNAIRLESPAELQLTASLGVSELRFKPTDPQDMINQADACLYVAKRGGRNCVIPYNPNIEQEEQQQSAESSDRVNISYPAVTALVSALSYRDVKTVEHSRRVADLCARASEGLLDPAETYVLEVAALLHDIGKIGVPDHILLKPGPLTPDEWELMGRHDQIGVEIVAGAFDCPRLTEIIATHHSFYNGKSRDAHTSSGDDIPTGARLLAICDAYDAMVSDRVYREGCSHEKAVAELRRCAGSQFDPELVEHFIKRVNGPQMPVARGAVAIHKQTAIQIGAQVDQLADAITSQDLEGLKSLAARLGDLARRSDIGSIADAASQIEQHANSENMEWLTLLRETRELLDICRAAQNAYLRESLEQEQIG